MFHVATVHWETDRWVDVQLGYLERHLGAPYRVYAYLDGAAAAHAGRFHLVLGSEQLSHAEKLNSLADRIAERADPSDVLVFIDGDAFPVARLAEPVAQMLAQRPLAAVRRAENLGSPQPHPCFCVTTVGFWQEIAGDWSEGHRWQSTTGVWETDVGANLLRTLEERGIEWTQLLRSNRRDLHPLLFGVYGDLVYHHGAGFREPLTRVDRRHVQERVTALRGTEQELRRRRRELREERAAENARLDIEVYERLRVDDNFWRELFY